MKNKWLHIIKIVIVLDMVFCSTIYFIQESFIFYPQELVKDFQFNFKQNFEELNFKTADGKLLNGLLFTANKTKGLIFYLHGNSGSLREWGNVAKTYTDLNYDIFILDYRGYGKSEGDIKNQQQLFEDNQIVYDALKKRYNEQDIIILGYSIGTGLAAKLASSNKPNHLILQAPYYSMTDLMHHSFLFVPESILKYKFATNRYLKACDIPVTIFHGTEDKIIYYGSSLKLKNEFQAQVNLIPLEGQGHNGITINKTYKIKLKTLLKE